MKEQYNLIS